MQKDYRSIRQEIRTKISPATHGDEELTRNNFFAKVSENLTLCVYPLLSRTKFFVKVRARTFSSYNSRVSGSETIFSRAFYSQENELVGWFNPQSPGSLKLGSCTNIDVLDLEAEIFMKFESFF